MSDPGKPSHGVQAYRWLVTIGTGATSLLAVLILNTVQRTADDVNGLKVDVSTVKTTQLHQNTRIDAIERRNEAQDTKIEALQQSIWRYAPPARPQ